MSTIYKYLAMGGVVLALLVSAGAIGFHLGGLAGAKQVSDLKTAEATSLAKGIQAAKDAQTQADQQQITAANQALLNEQQDDAQRLKDLAHLNDANSNLKRKLAYEIAANKTLAVWADLPVPAQFLDDPGMCWSSGGVFAAACYSDTHQVRSPAGRRSDTMSGTARQAFQYR